MPPEPLRRAVSRLAFFVIVDFFEIGVHDGVVGALTAAGLAGRFAPRLKLPPRSLAAALIGGLIMGYGARLAFGCNIGAFFSGVASTSLHGWLWIVCALLGPRVGVRRRAAGGFQTAHGGRAGAATRDRGA